MGAGPAAGRLEVLTRLGNRLAGISSSEAAANELTTELATLRVAASVSVIQSDKAVLIAVNVPPGLDTRVQAAAAARLVGISLPVDGVDAIREAVRLRRPFYGVAGGVETLRSLTVDSSLARALPSAASEPEVAAVPVLAGDHVLAVVCVWGPGCEPDLVPTLEAAATMLAGTWVTERNPTMDRFQTTAGRPHRQLRGAIESLIKERGIAAAMQPVVRLYDGSVIGYEALARFAPRPHIAAPDALFAAASALRLQTSVDRACLRAALSDAHKLGDADLFANVLIGTVLTKQGMTALENAVRHAGVEPSSIVLEFSEREPVTDLSRLQRIAAELRGRGFRIAVDDAGAGHASMRVIAELRPEFIKIDGSLIKGIDSNRARRALVVALLSFSGHIGARLIAEGVETEAEQQMLLSLGVQFGQGWLLGRPVLARPVPGLDDVDVVDTGWFARQRVSRITPQQAAMLPPAPAPAPRQAAPQRARSGLPRALSDAALALQSEHDPMRILGVMAEQLSRVVPVTEMAIFVADYETHQLVPVLATGPDRDEILADSFSLDAGLTGFAFGRGTPENIGNTSTHPVARQVPGTAVVEESLLLIPLVAGEHKLGIINCWRLGVDRFSKRELEAASLFAHIAAAAWRNAQLYTELLNAAMTDPLTRLYNSRWLREEGERDIARAERNGQPLAMLLIDLDHFKTVNDTAGHAVGDIVLQRVASRLRSLVRGADAVVRLGGEEFVALLHDCNVEGAGTVAEAVRLSMRAIALPDGCGMDQLTASIGTAAYPEHGHDLDALLAAADRAMYVAKQSGRDRVVQADSDTDLSVVPLVRSRQVIRSGGLLRGAG